MRKVAAHVTGTVTRIEKHPGDPRQVAQPVSEGGLLAVIE